MINFRTTSERNSWTRGQIGLGMSIEMNQDVTLTSVLKYLVNFAEISNAVEWRAVYDA
jgi:hypothetical protein